MKVKNVSDIPTDWKVLNVRKRTTVKIRDAKVVESFKVSWQDAELMSDPNADYIVIQPNGSEYPCKKDIFWSTYEVSNPPDFYSEDYSKSSFDYDYIKKATTQLVEIPKGVSVEIETLEGTLPAVTFPNFIAIGVKGELYANTLEFFENNLEIV